MNRKHKKRLEIAIKIVVVGLLAYVLYQQVFGREDLEAIQYSFLTHFKKGNLYWLFLSIGLMPFNWAFETLKWQTLIKNFEEVSFFTAYRGILSGITFSLFTPNRIGEYGGRILIVKPENNWKAVIATLVGSFCQMLILLGFGLVGLLFISHQFLEIEPILISGLISLGLILVGLMIFAFYNIDLFIPFIKRLPFVHYLKRFVKHIKILKTYTSKELSTALMYGSIRYAIYSLQYYFMLQFFGLQVPFWTGIASIASIYLFQTSIPLPPVIGLLTRGQIALFVWKNYTENQIDILAATFGLFILNLIFPALLGLLFIVSTNLMQTLGLAEKVENSISTHELTSISEKNNK